MDELLFLVPAVIGMAGAVTAGQWWFEAHTRWLARLFARGLIESHVEPWEPPRRLVDNLNPRWMSRQRIAGHDLAKLFSNLLHTPDEDRTTEIWRVRALRRSRLTLWVGLAWLASTGLYPAAYGVAGWTGVVVVSALLLVVYVVWGRKLYARLRSWGEYDRPGGITWRVRQGAPRNTGAGDCCILPPPSVREWRCSVAGLHRSS